MTKGVFLYRSDSIYEDYPEDFYRFPPQYLSRASQFVGDWVIYMEPVKAGPRGYHAVAKVEKIVPDPSNSEMYLALIEQGSFLPFGNDVPFRIDGDVVERGILNDLGNISGRAQAAVRPLSNADFNRIVDLGLVEEGDILPRDGGVPDINAPAVVQEEQTQWEGLVDRASVLVNRNVRDRQFRTRVLQAYGSQCALTGLRFINGGGRAEAQAAHIMPVEVGGPDVVSNGIALSGTIHWMFDRGLVSMSDQGEILLSNKINDIDSVEKIIWSDRKARFPDQVNQRPHPRYLAWHRDNCFYG